MIDQPEITSVDTWNDMWNEMICEMKWYVKWNDMMYVCMYVCYMYACMYVNMYVCMNVYIFYPQHPKSRKCQKNNRFLAVLGSRQASYSPYIIIKYNRI